LENNCTKADPSLKRFDFTLKNPHNFPEMKFAPQAEKKDGAIVCVSLRSPHFRDIDAFDGCNTNTASGSSLGGCYANDTGLDGETVLTGSSNFAVKEIKVFEITD
jgi:hypothetical protein